MAFDSSFNRKPFALLVCLLSIASGALFIHSYLGTTWSQEIIFQTLLLTVVAWLAEALAVQFSHKVYVSCANLPILLGVFFLGPAPAAIIASLSSFTPSRQKNIFRILFNFSLNIIAAILASYTYQMFLSFPQADISSAFISMGFLFSAFASSIIWEISNYALVSLGASIAFDKSISSLWKNNFFPALPTQLVMIGIGLTISAVYLKAGVAATVLFFIPIFASQHVYKLLVQQKDLLAQQTKLSEELMEMNIGLAGTLIMLLDSKDHYTANHSAGVAMYCRDMAKLMGMNDDQRRIAHMAGLLHDLGKVGTPDAVLKKEGELTSQEWEQVKQHPTTAAEVLSQLATHKEIADIIRHHQEHFDGSGYPYGLSGEEIPELSRMLAVADTYHALTSTRPYREAKNPFEALMVLRRVAGTQLDPKYVELLAQVLKDEDLTYRKGSRADFLSEFRKGRPAFMKDTLARAKS